ncbi:MAG: hypothetical protein Q8R18_03310 [bacterium]|nr:hypothetical protein [bacterium]
MKTFLLLFALFLIPFVHADSSNYNIDSVYVNGIEVNADTKVQVELGSTAQIQVYLEGAGEATDVRVRAWIGGYEYGSIEETSEVFEINNGISYKKILNLKVPEDLDVSSNEYTLHVEVYDSEERENREYVLYFEQERHDVVVEDILFSANTVAPGDYLSVKVRLENQGAKDEENLKITVSIPELGISNRVYMDELASGEQESAQSAYLVIPRDAAGEHEVLVSVSYNNDYSEIIERSFILVSGEQVYDEDTFVSISSITDLVAGEESSYKVQVTNLGENTKLFYLTVEGLNPEYTEKILVAPRSSGEFIFTLEPEEAGASYVFVQVDTDEGMVAQKLFSVDVQEKSSVAVVLVSVVVVLLIAGFVIAYLRRL